MWTFKHELLALLSFFAVVSFQQNDPLSASDFCRLFGHQTALVDRKVYIDGGLRNWNPFSTNSTNDTNIYLLYADLDVDDQGFPEEYDNLTKNATIPSVAGGILWPDSVNKWLYLYGGEFNQPASDSFAVWAYDIINNVWTVPQADVSGISRASYGSGAVDSVGRGWWYGGWLSNMSVPGWGGDRMALSSLLSYNMTTNEFVNSTGPDSIGRAEGAMLYIPASDNGILIYFGGVQTPSGNSTWEGVPMNEIFVYAISDGKWYKQNATGQIPDMRRRFCAGATWAKDQSSYNIYLYGGASVSDDVVGFDDVYILSLPSFTWIRWWQDSPPEQFPKNSMSCTVVDGAQMLIMGGTYPNSTACDLPAVQGQHNLDLGKDNPQNTQWHAFQANVTSYQVPPEVLATIGGSATGGAIKSAPTAGWSNQDLQVDFGRTMVPVTLTPTRSIPSTATNSPTTTPTHHSSNHAGAIAGGTVGGVVGLALILGLVYFLLRRRRQQKQPAPLTVQTPQEKPPDREVVAELPSPEMTSAKYKHSHHPSDGTAVSDMDPRYSHGGTAPYGLFPQSEDGPAPAYSGYAHAGNPLAMSPVESDSGQIAELGASNSTRRSKFTEGTPHRIVTGAGTAPTTDSNLHRGTDTNPGS